MMSSRPSRLSSSIASALGSCARRPGSDSDHVDVVFDRLRAASGVLEERADSTSKPRSANAVEITFAPRSWPSWPIFATRMRGRGLRGGEPAFCASLLDSGSPCSPTSRPRRSCGSRPGTARNPLERLGDFAQRCAHPRRFTASSSRFPRRVRGASSVPPALPSPRRVARAPHLGQPAHLDSRTPRYRLRARRALPCALRRYLLTPTIISRPESIRACLRAAASSMRILGIPVSMVLAMPPTASTSWM